MGTIEHEKIYALLDEIKTLIKENEKEDGTFQFDPVRALIALDFAKTEIAKTIDSSSPA
ncbi:MAG: hypothetical protein K2P41_13205 [Lachnospiraceae bacterium]|nr:hypothetical protein [Lachnospiraceae bacterium]